MESRFVVFRDVSVAKWESGGDVVIEEIAPT
jgi:hypothetical protein